MSSSTTKSVGGKTAKLASYIKLLSAMREHLSETITPRKAQMFFEIAQQSGISSTELGKRCQLAQPKVSTIVHDLGQGDLGLVVSWIPEHPRNIRLHRLSQKGQRALAQIMEDMAL